MKRIYLLGIGVLFSTLLFAQSFSDDFESYSIGDYLGQTSPNWTTWSGATGGVEDVQVSAINASSGTQSIYFSSTSSSGGPQDVVLPFGQIFNSGEFTFEMDLFVENGKSAYFNFQGDPVLGNIYTMNCFMQDGGAMAFNPTGLGPHDFVTPYPINQWFNLRLEINLITNSWEVFIDNFSRGTFYNSSFVTQLSSLDIFPFNQSGNQSGFYIDNVSYNYIPQLTAIPDPNFEGKLISLGYDTAPIDGFVPTGNINNVTTLNLFLNNITDLTGIQDFTALIELECRLNQLTTIDVTQNLALRKLSCGSNLLTNLDVTQNLALTSLDCAGNQLTTLDVTQNILLDTLSCNWGNLTSLDLTQNTALIYLNCGYNQLTCLNIKNGNNFYLGTASFYAWNNPNLTCIEVDNEVYSNINWTNVDAGTTFSTNCANPCSTFGVNIDETGSAKISIFPNPTIKNISIDLKETYNNLTAALTNSLGQIILSKKYSSANFITLEIDAPKGIYFLQLETNGKVITKKIVKE